MRACLRKEGHRIRRDEETKNSKKKRDVETERERERVCERGGEIGRERVDI